MKYMIVSGVILLFLSSCATKITSMGKVGKGDLDNGSYLLLTFDQSVEIDHTCFFNFEEKNSKNEFMVYPEEKNLGVLLVKLPSGIYELNQVGCKKNKIIFDSLSPMTVKDHGVFYGSHFVMSNFDEHRVRLNYSLYNKNGYMKDAIERSGVSLETGIVFSAYTGNRITQTMFEHESKRGGSYVTIKDNDNSEINMPDMNVCFQNELEKNPLMLGENTIEATYYQTKAIDIKTVKKNSSLSQEYFDCLRKELRKFKPNVAKKITYTISM